MLGRREFMGTAAAAGLLAGCKVSTAPAGQSGSAELAAKLQGIAEKNITQRSAEMQRSLPRPKISAPLRIPA